MPVKSSGSLKLNSDLGWEYGKITSQSTSMSWIRASGEAGSSGKFSAYYGTKSARSVPYYTSPVNLFHLNVPNNDRLLEWTFSIQDFSHRIYNATAGGAPVINFYNVNFPSGLEPFGHDGYYWILNQGNVPGVFSCDTNGSISYSPGSSRRVELTKIPSYPGNAQFNPGHGAVMAEDSGEPNSGAYDIKVNVTGYSSGPKGFCGFFNPRLWFNRTATILDDNQTQTFYIPFVKDPQVNILSGSVFPYYNPNSALGGPQALEVVTFDIGGVYIRNRFAGQSGINPSSYDVDYVNTGTPYAASVIQVNYTASYQGQNWSSSFYHWVNYRRLNVASGGGGY